MSKNILVTGSEGSLMQYVIPVLQKKITTSSELIILLDMEILKEKGITNL